MYTIGKIAKRFNFKEDHIRYWMTRNLKDYKAKLTNINLEDYCFITYHKTQKQILILYVDLFVQKYLEYREEERLRRVKNKELAQLRWTRASYECWQNKGNCKICFNQRICKRFKNPPIKDTVKILLEKIGEPYKDV